MKKQYKNSMNGKYLKTMIDTSCDPAFPRNCVDHPADCNLFKNIKLLNSQ